jgi:hypothetical protein
MSVSGSYGQKNAQSAWLFSRTDGDRPNRLSSRFMKEMIEKEVKQSGAAGVYLPPEWVGSCEDHSHRVRQRL